VGVRAANVLGLSSEVPAQVVYLIDGSSRKITVGYQIIHFKHAGPSTLFGAGTPAGVALQGDSCLRARPPYRRPHPAASAEPAVRCKNRTEEACESRATVDGFGNRRGRGLTRRVLRWINSPYCLLRSVTPFSAKRRPARVWVRPRSLKRISRSAGRFKESSRVRRCRDLSSLLTIVKLGCLVVSVLGSRIKAVTWGRCAIRGPDGS
jgi:hypothetical protein